MSDGRIKSRTLDSNSFYTTEKLSDNQELTPEGFLLCRNVAVGRTGVQTYLSDEIGIDGIDGIVTVNRTEDQVFHERTISSFEGKPITITHPYDMDGVTPKNFSSLCRGVMQNVRRGVGEEKDLLLADLLIMDQQAIDDVQAKKYTEVSLGYDCDYVQDGPGIAHQENIIGNHVALVEHGRAGNRCSIKDHEGINMAASKKPNSLIAKLLKGFYTKDQAVFDEAVEELEKSTKDEESEYEKSSHNKNDEGEAYKRYANDAFADLKKSIDAMNERMDKMEGKSCTGDEEETDPEDMTADTLILAETAAKIDTGKSYTGDSVKDTISRSEILAPGFKVQTTDAANSYGKLVKTRQKVLDTALKNESTKDCVTPFLQGKTLDSMTVREINTAFIAASELAKAKNNSAGTRTSTATYDFGSAPKSVADINKINAEFWAKRGS